VAMLLLESGADLNVEDASGRTPLSLARQKGNDSVVAILLADRRTRDQSAPAEPMAPGEDDGLKVDAPAIAVPADEEACSLLALANRERTQKGLAPLVYDSKAETVAQAKAEDMAKNDYIGHNSPTYGTPASMLKRAGVESARLAESIVACESISAAQVSMMKAQDCRRNLTSRRYTRAAIGVARGGQWGRVYVLLLLGS
jgi:uncharacterized protein YkwD